MSHKPADSAPRKLWRDGVPEVVTAEWLRARGACSNQVEQFATRFPDGTPITGDAIRACAWLDLGWFVAQAAEAPLREQHQAAVAPLLVQYEEAEAPLREQYQAAVAALWAQYEAAAAALLEQRQAAVAALRGQYQAAEAPLRAQYGTAAAAWLARRIEQEEVR